MKKLLSIIIPHYNDLEGLLNCLESIGHLSDSYFEDFEVIVCDNNSPHFKLDTTPFKFDIKIVKETERGAGPARNKGVSIAIGKYLAFTDCDCWLDKNFVSIGLEFIKRLGDTAVVLGEVIIDARNNNSPSSIEAFEQIFLMDQEKCARNGDGATGNLWTSRSLFETIGPFRSGIAEDTDWCKRALSHGASFHFNAYCIVHHPARTTLQELKEKWGRQTAMNYNQVRTKQYFYFKWTILTIATAASGFLHIPKALLSNRIPKKINRLKAIPTLVWCRFYRAKLMLKFLISGKTFINPIEYWK
ncbi:glycosyltransferase family 2 protein [Sneathiella limimaris]|uniref:glycosyltransferase family 2 protein n=1 Tax=Sneathiella limimaris TaxID=1964213 RepID=UPI00146AD5A4|nr:glycosyltransferase family 2 protein [Sneathiella limimaris]